MIGVNINCLYECLFESIPCISRINGWIGLILCDDESIKDINSPLKVIFGPVII